MYNQVFEESLENIAGKMDKILVEMKAHMSTLNPGKEDLLPLKKLNKKLKKIAEEVPVFNIPKSTFKMNEKTISQHPVLDVLYTRYPIIQKSGYLSNVYQKLDLDELEIPDQLPSFKSESTENIQLELTSKEKQNNKKNYKTKYRNVKKDETISAVKKNLDVLNISKNEHNKIESSYAKKFTTNMNEDSHVNTRHVIQNYHLSNINDKFHQENKYENDNNRIATMNQKKKKNLIGSASPSLPLYMRQLIALNSKNKKTNNRSSIQDQEKSPFLYPDTTRKNEKLYNRESQFFLSHRSKHLGDVIRYKEYVKDLIHVTSNDYENSRYRIRNVSPNSRLVNDMDISKEEKLNVKKKESWIPKSSSIHSFQTEIQPYKQDNTDTNYQPSYLIKERDEEIFASVKPIKIHKPPTQILRKNYNNEKNANNINMKEKKNKNVGIPCNESKTYPLLKRRSRKIIRSKSLMARPSNHYTTTVLSFNKNTKSQTPTKLHNLLQHIMNLVEKAKIDKKTFTYIGKSHIIRNAMTERGWIEKFRVPEWEDKNNYKHLENLSNIELTERILHPVHGDKYRKALMSKLLSNHQVDFYWDTLAKTKPLSINSDKVKRTLINRYPAGATRAYTSKVGLCDSLRSNQHWFFIEGKSNILYPRTYNLARDDEKDDFIKDFRMTAAASLLKWVATSDEEIRQLTGEAFKIPLSVFNFALLQCHNYVRTKQHKDIDEVVPESKECDWDMFMDNFYKIAHSTGNFKEEDKELNTIMIRESKAMVKRLRKYWPHINVDGYMNLWIMKPHRGTRGLGIALCRTLKYILDLAKHNQERKYIVQKYIERPLLLYNTKFDIRQWFLVSHQPVLHVWMYKTSYLRFSSQMFTLENLHESIHLTNNSVQRKYKNCKRSSALPTSNMWHSDKFQEYLISIGQPKIWEDVIYKGMKESMVGIVMCCIDKIGCRINSFELFGADFVLNEQFQPYIIEINSRPATHASTEVTDKMVGEVMKDIVKATVDYARDSNSDTGNFELIFRDDSKIFHVTEYSTNLSVDGMNYFNKQETQNVTNKENKENMRKNSHEKKGNKKNLKRILSAVHIEQEKRKADEEEKEYQCKQFKNMLSEFANILTTTPINPSLSSKQ